MVKVLAIVLFSSPTEIAAFFTCDVRDSPPLPFPSVRVKLDQWEKPVGGVEGVVDYVYEVKLSEVWYPPRESRIVGNDSAVGIRR